ncbi:hypothetical protein [Sorangium cellulosum]|uniref:Uncharacterized protein n=1 Tax=Sorangium cellulosum So0157-2 TaxID=1254432 RepID=S4XVB8_SORCE|nr:hypothetical protein [Sorangium cellulosum]AGP37177.1 hypothetical protein SCE1572_23440 [Sorangium cellulosum So0157-2]
MPPAPPQNVPPLREREYPVLGCDAYGAEIEEAPKPADAAEGGAAADAAEGGAAAAAAVAAQDVMLFLKDTPPEARQCGGIGTWSIPAAQVAASFYVDARRLVFDPVTSRVGAEPPR